MPGFSDIDMMMNARTPINSHDSSHKLGMELIYHLQGMTLVLVKPFKKPHYQHFLDTIGGFALKPLSG
eukprot:snap_masked-scaffold_1-processed-gene-21.28-mRNA-1 protein AED:1.00 eAED:1.00 QI:0/0/0/0/1/1/2/0/67